MKDIEEKSSIWKILKMLKIISRLLFNLTTRLHLQTKCALLDTKAIKGAFKLLKVAFEAPFVAFLPSLRITSAYLRESATEGASASGQSHQARLKATKTTLEVASSWKAITSAKQCKSTNSAETWVLCLTMQSGFFFEKDTMFVSEGTKAATKSRKYFFCFFSSAWGRRKVDFFHFLRFFSFFSLDFLWQR